MSTSPADVRQIVVDFLSGVGKLSADFASDTPLYGGGVGLDSLETAELAVTLEAAFGHDPFGASSVPGTLDEIVAFYAAAPG